MMYSLNRIAARQNNQTRLCHLLRIHEPKLLNTSSAEVKKKISLRASRHVKEMSAVVKNKTGSN